MSRLFVILILFGSLFSLTLLVVGEQVEVRLIGGRTPFEGKVEVRRGHQDPWRYMCGTGAGWNLTVARAICKQLGYSTVMWEWPINDEFGKSNRSFSICDITCDLLAGSIESCTVDWDNNGTGCQCNMQHVGITCYYPGFLGRYKDNNTRIFGKSIWQKSNNNNNTIEVCIKACRDRKKNLAGLQSGGTCYCGDESHDYRLYGEAIPGLPIRDDVPTIVYDTKQCTGDHGTAPFIEGCGGDWQMDIYNTSFGACGGDYNGSSGYIYSPNFPGNYTNNQSCTWTITVGPGHIVKVTTLVLKLQDGDMVIVKDGIEADSPNISVFTGSSVQEPLYSSTNTLLIQMSNDSNGADQGFVLKYEAILTPTTKTITGGSSNANTAQETEMTSSVSDLSTSNPYSAMSNPQDMKMYTGIGIGVGIFLLLVLALIIIVVAMLRKKSRTKQQRTEEYTLTRIPDVIRESGPQEEVRLDVTTRVNTDRNAAEDLAFENKSYNPNIDKAEFKSGTRGEVLIADYEVLGPANEKESAPPKFNDQHIPKVGETYAEVDISQKTGRGKRTTKYADDKMVDQQDKYDDARMDSGNDEAPAVPERRESRLEDIDLQQMYAQVDKSRKQAHNKGVELVDNMLYESISADSKIAAIRKFDEGFVDNTLYESANEL